MALDRKSTNSRQRIQANLPDWSSLVPVLPAAGRRTPALYRELRRLIEAGDIPPGSKLPPSRDLAQRLKTSRGSVVAAFEMLIAEGYAVARTGAGTFVADRVPTMKPAAFPEAEIVEPKMPLPGTLGVAMAERGRKILLVDLDPQASLTWACGVDPDLLEVSIHDVLLKRAKAEDAIVALPTPTPAKEAQQAANAAEAHFDDVLRRIGNPVIDGVPAGGEDDYVVLKEVGGIPSFDFEPRDHLELGELLGAIDMPRGAKVAGARFSFLRGIGARLEIALMNMALDKALQNGFVPMITPTLVKPEVM